MNAGTSAFTTTPAIGVISGTSSAVAGPPGTPGSIGFTVPAGIANGFHVAISSASLTSPPYSAENSEQHCDGLRVQSRFRHNYAIRKCASVHHWCSEVDDRNCHLPLFDSTKRNDSNSHIATQYHWSPGGLVFSATYYIELEIAPSSITASLPTPLNSGLTPAIISLIGTNIVDPFAATTSATYPSASNAASTTFSHQALLYEFVFLHCPSGLSITPTTTAPNVFFPIGGVIAGGTFITKSAASIS